MPVLFCSFIFSVLIFNFSFSQDHASTLYLIPGIGADGRIFRDLRFNNCDTVILNFIPLGKNESLPEYAGRMAAKIDTTKPFSILGVSFGGMIAIEISKFLKPEKIFLVSSAKTRSELPSHYRMACYFPFIKIFTGNFYKKMANLLRPVYEPESRKETALFRQMTNETDPKVMKRSVHCIVNWKNKEYPGNVIHLHGEMDHTLPIKKIKNPVEIKGGSHEMILLRAEEISRIINEELGNKTKIVKD
jgi:pimeloyl-ACP methyl ester carboxylesterase